MAPQYLVLLSLLAPALCAVDLAPRACGRTVVAKQGDTCASVASASGTTVSQFLNLNPTLANCALVAGREYCVSDTPGSAPAPTTTSAPAAPPGTTPPSGLKVSEEGDCGAGVTCLGSGFGDCCSEHGYCGGSADYCGSGCQAAFGKCAVDTGTTTIGKPPGGGGGGGATSTVTKTAFKTVTSVMATTVTAPGPANTLCPIQEGSVNNCVDFHKVRRGENCENLTAEYGITTSQFRRWNPSVSDEF
ncbi:uncharacterized protein E0L32_006615 [Thyridium curvatum]|uniref:Uncharacterized protein n=1 Tax=Thyridium curvatum TaxID=1093900 RepID=A0A507B8K5_9PEZI|nr:uncharacterized protein E0L32_006615 [Thyridium curvatum]TPX12970.1 hypothetical protein E0L32_006615 [Thyridium curvatum]